MYLRQVIAACAACLGLMVSSLSGLQAAEIYSPPPKYAAPVAAACFPICFQGFYLGAHIGGAWADLSEPDRNFLFPNSATAFPFRGGDFNNSSVFGGMQGGYNFQNGPFVFGLEIDIGGIGTIMDNRNIHIQGLDATTFADLRTRGDAGWYGDVTGRLGYAWGPTMLYAKGGFAWAAPNLSATETVVVGGNVVTATQNGSNNDTLTGWTVGGGLEYLMNPSWSFKIEYLFFDFTGLSNNGCCFDGTNNFRFFDRDLQVNTVKIGVNYIFHPDLPLR